MSRSVVPLLFLLLGAVANAQSSSTLQTRTVDVGGLTRTWRIHVPAGLAPPEGWPLVIGFHGGGGNAESFARNGWNGTADANRFLMVYPEGTGRFPGVFLGLTWNGGGCCGIAQQRDVDDVAFVDALIDAVDREWGVDQRRVFATGFSNGGIMAYRLGVALAHRLAAIAPVGASFMASEMAERPIPVLAIHGALDRNVPWQGGVGIGPSGVSFTSQEDSLAPFLAINGIPSLPALPTRIEGQALHFEATGSRAAMGYWWLLDQGHTWPGQPTPRDPNEPFNTDLDVNQEIWDFFAAHPRERSVSVEAPGCSLPGRPAPDLLIGVPAIGRDLEIAIERAPVFLPGALFVSFPGGPGIPLGTGCRSPLEPSSLARVADLGPGASAALSVRIPLDPALVGVEVLAQAVWLGSGGLLASPARRVTFGW